MSRHQHIVLIMFVAIAILAFLGARGLNEPDEGRYAEIAREMVVSGDWLVPTLSGFAHFQKPPMIYWFTAVSFKLFGFSEWAARLPSALSALATVWLTFAIGRRWFGERTGIVAAIILVTSVEFFILAKILTPDMLLTFWITAALASFVRWTAAPGQRRRLWMFFLAMGLGFLTKGPMAFVVPASAAIGWQIVRKRQNAAARIPWTAGMLLSLVVGLSWHIIIALKHPHLFYYFLNDELIGRVATTRHGRYQSPFFFIPTLAIGLLPWTFVLPSLTHWLSNELKRWPKLDPTLGLLGGWTVVPFIILSLSGSKLLTYVLPLYPAIALALAAWWTANSTRHDFTWEAAAVVMLFLLAIFALIILGRLIPSLNALITLPVLVGLGVAALLIGAVIVPPKTDPFAIFATIAASTTGVWLLLFAQADDLNELLGRQASVRTLAERIVNSSAETPPVFAYGVNAPGLQFYLGRCVAVSKADAFLPLTPEQQTRLLTSPVDTDRLRVHGKPLFGLVRTDKIGKDFPPDRWKLLETAGDFALIELREGNARAPTSRGTKTSQQRD